MASKLHARSREGTAIALALTMLIAACSNSVEPTKGTIGPAPVDSPAPILGSSAAPARTAAASAGSSAAPARTAAGSTGGSAAPARTAAGSTAPTGPALTTTFVRDETHGEEEFGLTKDEVIRRVDATEGLIARCMADAGFEYFPVDYATARKAMNSNSKPSGLSADEFRNQFGYGISTLFAGPTTQATLGAGERNRKYKAGLSTADRVAYDRTLYGENPNYTFVVGLDREDFAQVGGCTRAAVQLIFSKKELGASFVNYQNAIGVRVDADPRVIAAYKDWSNCMRQAGYAYNTAAEIQADLAARLDKATAGAAPDALSTEAKAALAALQGEEKAIAAADHACDLTYVADIKRKVEAEILGPNATP